MDTFIIYFENKRYELQADENKSVLDVLRENGFVLNAYCGGHGTCGKCKILRGGEEVLACRTAAKGGVTVRLPDGGYVFDDGAPHKINVGGRCDIAMDIGTTTIVLALIDRGEIIRKISFLNPQISYGSDVVSRIKAAQDGFARNLHDCLADVLNEKISELISDCGCKTGSIIAAGNTTMLHILLNRDCVPLGRAPFKPAFLKSQRVSAQSAGIKADCDLITVDCISAFAGGDITAGLHALPLPSDGCYNVLIDLGTNAEIAVYGNGVCKVTSAAAGPCFEGGNISCGSNCSAGAICRAEMKNGVFSYETIGGKRAVSVCGTGLIDVMAVLFSNGYIDGNGSFLKGNSFEIADGVTLTQNDVRQFQLAKSAIYSAVEVLLDYTGAPKNKVGKVFISGGFSTKLDVKNAVVCGLIDKEFENICEFVENTSLKGTVKFAADRNVNPIFTSAEYVDLSTDAEFCKKFIVNTAFTDV